jgi:hypothetical protein
MLVSVMASSTVYSAHALPTSLLPLALTAARCAAAERFCVLLRFIKLLVQ